jgi:hypothetical protein
MKSNGGFWQYDILATLVKHHGWLRHVRADQQNWNCGYDLSETHFHPPVR